MRGGHNAALLRFADKGFKEKGYATTTETCGKVGHCIGCIFLFDGMGAARANTSGFADATGGLSAVHGNDRDM